MSMKINPVDTSNEDYLDQIRRQEANQQPVTNSQNSGSAQTVNNQDPAKQAHHHRHHGHHRHNSNDPNQQNVNATTYTTQAPEDVQKVSALDNLQGGNARKS